MAAPRRDGKHSARLEVRGGLGERTPARSLAERQGGMAQWEREDILYRQASLIPSYAYANSGQRTAVHDGCGRRTARECRRLVILQYGETAGSDMRGREGHGARAVRSIASGLELPLDMREAKSVGIQGFRTVGRSRTVVREASFEPCPRDERSERLKRAVYMPIRNDWRVAVRQDWDWRVRAVSAHKRTRHHVGFFYDVVAVASEGRRLSFLARS